MFLYIDNLCYIHIYIQLYKKLETKVNFGYFNTILKKSKKLQFSLSSRNLFGNLMRITTHGVLMHSSLAVTTAGLPLGLAAIKFFTSKKFIGANELKRHINATRIPINKKESIRWLENLRQATTLIDDPNRCIHIGDRESDIYELFCEAQKVRTHFLVRTCVDRLAGDGNHTIAAEMKGIKVKGIHCIEVRDNKGNVSKAKLKIRYHSITVLPPTNKSKYYPKLPAILILKQ